MKISYAIPVCNEHEELHRLLTLLTENKRDEDEIVVQSDLGNTTPEVYKVIEEFKPKVTEVRFPLDKHFANFKNHLKSKCTGDWIVQIDADEMLDPVLVQNMHEVLDINPLVEVFYVARVNTVEGLTKEHISRWGWNVDENDRVNFPDYQMRILKNLDKIQWVNKVHEKIVGHTSHAFFPTEDGYCILHHKSIAKQETQNKLYENI